MRLAMLILLGTPIIPSLVAGVTLTENRLSDSPANPLASFDHEIQAFMRARKVPGGALAVTKHGRLVYARGYGWADREKQVPVRPNSLFRIASISKPITAIAILKLFESNQIDLDAPAFDALKLTPFLEPGRVEDSRLKKISIRQLLHHSGGWDRDKSFDPMFRSKRIAETLGIPGPPHANAIVRYMLGQPLDFEPGTRYAYSNFGYCVLGRFIETVSGQSYERFVKEAVLQPLGIKNMRLGASRPEGRAHGEVHYYTPNNATGPSVFPGVAKKVPLPYGTFCLEAMDAHGGWLASAVDLARLTAVLDETGHEPLLKAETRQILLNRPAVPLWRTEDGQLQDYYYACGWLVRPNGKNGRPNYWHNGSLPGTYSLLVYRGDGLSWAVLFNQRSNDPKLPDNAIDPALHRAADAVTHWPDIDLFPQFGMKPERIESEGRGNGHSSFQQPKEGLGFHDSIQN